MKVLFCALKNEYGKPEAGQSFECKHFLHTLQHMPGIEVRHFGFDEIMREHGRDRMNEMLIEAVGAWQPDVLFCFLFTEEIKKETIRHITQHTKTKTFNWFGDDHWRFYVYSQFWAKEFTLVSTTDGKAYREYHKAGIQNVLKTQWAVNHFLYKPQDSALNKGTYDITFYGQKYGNRPDYIEALVKAGLPAQGIGRGWGNTSGADVQEMLNIYSFSKINLNFTETPYFGFKKKLNLLAKLFVKKELGKYSLNLNFPILNLKSIIGTQRRTIKARTFEVPACGGFLLTGPSDDPLDEYLKPGKEVVVFNTMDDMVAKAKYYLNHASERQAIAKAGYERTLAEHTYEKRFKEIFENLA